jgi:ethanolamine ammonia-lyase large subunit
VRITMNKITNTSTLAYQEELKNRVIDRLTPEEFVTLMGWTIEDLWDSFSDELQYSYAELEEILTI